MAAIDRNNADDTWNRGLPESEQTLSSQRVAKEKELNNLKIQNIASINKLSADSISKLKKLEKKSIEDINTYKKDLEEKLNDEILDGKLDVAEYEKKLADKVANYITKKRIDEKNQRIEDIKEEYQVKKKQIEGEQKLLTKVEKQGIKRKLKNLSTERKQNKAAAKELNKQLKSEGVSRKDRQAALADNRNTGIKYMFDAGWRAKLGQNITKSMEDLTNSLLSGLKQKFDNTIQTYGTYQGKINTRLQGSAYSWNGITGTSNVEANLKKLVGATPYVKLQTVMDNVVRATESGIANNIEQRAFLATISENIAATFDAFDANLLKIIRVQQADSTAARLGMEAGLTSFLNQYFADNSYLDSAFDTVSQNIFDATSQLTAETAVDVEYQIQKWLGSLYSVGFSDSAIGKISQALGYLGSGNISSLSSDTAMQNLMVMAMNRANLSYGDLMTKGLTASSTNELLESMVEYLKEIANSDNKIVKSQYAEIFGMSVSDLKAATNLANSIDVIANQSMNYADSVGELFDQMKNDLADRISVAGILQNLYDNVNYSIGTGIAANPAAYALWQITSAIEDLTGGINLPTVSVMGNAVDLNTTVTNLMRAGLVGYGTLGSIGSIINGVSTFGDASKILTNLGIGSTPLETKARGASLNRRQTTKGLSKSSYIGNSSGEDYYQQSITSAEDEADKKLKQKQMESQDINLNNIHEYLLSVFDPKITEIEKLMAIMAGYNVKTANWSSNNFKGSVSGNYNATTVKVIDNSQKDIQSNNNLLTKISDNSTKMLDLLSKVISDSGVKIDNSLLNYTTSGSRFDV